MDFSTAISWRDHVFLKISRQNNSQISAFLLNWIEQIVNLPAIQPNLVWVVYWKSLNEIKNLIRHINF